MKLKSWTRPLRQIMEVPGDKSLTHRSVLFSALVQGTMEITRWLDAADIRSSLGLVEALGVRVREMTTTRLVLQGPGYRRLVAPSQAIDCGNSGTTIRLAMGLLSGIAGDITLTGDASLRRRPMRRVQDPLSQIGVRVTTAAKGTAPVIVHGAAHSGGAVTMAVPSAQVKSAVLLAGLSSDHGVVVQEPLATRDHTERMLRAMGADIAWREGTITVNPSTCQPMAFTVPGDPSSGAFWAALAALLPGSFLTLKGVSLNPGRIGFYQVLQRMGAAIEFVPSPSAIEPLGDIVIKASAHLRAFSLQADEIPSLVDELPLLALLATQAHGTTVIGHAEELRVKESDRIATTVEGLRAMGAQISARPDGFVIEGPTPLSGATVDAHDDHRIAMMLAVAGAIASGESTLNGAEAAQISYPQFFQEFDELFISMHE